MIWGLGVASKHPIVKHELLKEGLPNSTLWTGGSVMVNLVKSDTITPFYQFFGKSGKWRTNQPLLPAPSL